MEIRSIKRRFGHSAIAVVLAACCGLTGCSYYQALKSDAESRELLAEAGPEAKADAEESPVVEGVYTLSDCLDMALEQNHKRPASQFAVAMAEAQHKQALSAYWPHLTLSANANLRSDDPDYIYPGVDFTMPETAIAVPEQSMTFPASSFSYPGQTLQTPATSVTIPANAFGPGFPPSNVQMPVASQSVNVPGGTIPVPEQTITIPEQQFIVPEQNFHLEEQDIKLMDRVTYGTQIDARWLLADGGGRKALREQAKLGVAAAEEDARRTDLEIVYDVKRMYAGTVLARQLEELGRETLERMEATLELTEQLYKGGSMQVQKTDYLRNKVLVEGLRGLIEKLKQNRLLAESALGQAMGLSWKSSLHPKQSVLKMEHSDLDLDSLVSDLYAFNPDWRQLEIGIDAAELKVREERSGLYPMVAFIGNLHAVQNDHDTGYATDSNLNAWNVGLGVEMPLWDGLLTYQRIQEAKARLGQLREQRIMIREGLATQLKTLVIRLDSMQAQEGYAGASEASATENRELTEKAYRNDLIEADKVFQAQIMEAVTQARRLKLRYDHQVQGAKIDLVVGRDIQDRLGLGRESIKLAATELTKK